MIDAVLTAVRLFAVAVLVFLGPGLVWSRLGPGERRPHPTERLVLAFAASYAWAFLLSVLLPLVHAPVDAALPLSACAVGAMLWRQRRARLALSRAGGVVATGRPLHAPAERIVGTALTVAVVGLAAAAWFVEAPVTGEEALDIASIARVADGQPLTLDNMALMPDTRSVYLFQPYQLAVGMVSRWSGVKPMVALVKLRPLFVALALSFVWAVLRRLAPSDAHAAAAFAVALAFVALDLGAWEANSLFPLVRRGGFSAGVCVPALMALTLAATGSSADLSSAVRRQAQRLSPVMLLAALATHPLEVATLLVFVAIRVLMTVAAGSRAGWRRPVLTMTVAMALAATGYVWVHQRAVPLVAAEEHQAKAAALNGFTQDHRTVASWIAGDLSDESEDLLGDKVPASVAGVIGVPALLVVSWAAPSAAILLTLAIVPLALMYASPGGTLLLALLISPDTVQDTNAYFALLGLLALSLALAALAAAVWSWPGAPRPAAMPGAVRWFAVLAAVAAAWTGSPVLVHALLEGTSHRPVAAVLSAAAIGVVAIALALARGRALVSAAARATAPPLASWASVPVALALAVPIALAGHAPQERTSVLSALHRSRTVPSVLDAAGYYPVLQNTIRPRLSVPFGMIEELARRVPPRSVVLADPRESCALVVLIDAYCVNPAAVYGHFFLSARHYMAAYVHSIDGRDEDWHPFFNDVWPPEAREAEMLREYRVAYLLADPEHAAAIERKLQTLRIGAGVVATRDGYVLYALNAAP